MPKIDWSPGRGRRGRPIRRVLGVGQRQGMIALSVLSGVMILTAAYAVLGGLAGSTHAVPSALPGRLASASPGAAPVDLAGSAKAAQLLLDSTQHYAEEFAAGQKIVGTTRYPDVRALSAAVADKTSPAAQLIAYRTDPNPEADVSYTQAFAAAGKALGGSQSDALGRWSSDMIKVHSDLGAWVDVAAQYQMSAAAQGALDAAASRVIADLETARADAAKVAG